MGNPQLVLLAGGLYVVLLLTLGLLGRRAQPARTLSEHFLAGRSLGFLVLLLTLFATQYSGNSLSGFPGKTYRSGLSYIMSVTFMIGIVSGYLLFVPQLFREARRGRYLTPTDYLTDRFRSPFLSYTSAVIFAVTLCNFLLAQLMALGHAVAGLTDGRVPYAAGVLGGMVVIFVYEWLGGLRAVAWTDALQGLILMVGLALVVGLLMLEVGTPAAVVAQILEVAPEKAANPSLQICLTWLSSFLLLGLGAPLYPQAIQRIYAARRLVELRKALMVMAVMPLFAITTVVFVGAVGIALFPNLDGVGSDQVTFRVLAYLVDVRPAAALPVLLVMMAVLAAIMSTADSALLSLSSILTKDFAARILGYEGSQAERLTRLAPIFSLAVLAGLGSLALQPRFTLWRLLEIKFEVLIQLSPAFVLGTLHHRGDRRAFAARDMTLGLVAGLVVALSAYAAGIRSLGGIHPGVLGVMVNYAAVLASRGLRLRGQGHPPYDPTVDPNPTAAAT
ncbi:MAG: sodium:solute symporter family protein [Acidobacteriota bacterium]